MDWKTIFPYSIPEIFFHSVSIPYQKSFIPYSTSILKFSFIFHSILPYQGKFKPEATRNLNCNFATLRVLLQVIAHECKQYGAIHLIPYLKHIAMTYHENSFSIKITTIDVAKIFDWWGSGEGKTQITCNDSGRNFQKVGFLWDRNIVK